MRIWRQRLRQVRPGEEMLRRSIGRFLRPLAGQDRVQDGSQPVDIGGRADPRAIARGLLGHHVPGCAERQRFGAVGLPGLIEQPGEAEVGDAGNRTRARFAQVQEHVSRFQVAMQHAARVRVGNGLGESQDQHRGGLGCDGVHTARQPVGQGGAVDVGHRQVADRSRLTEVVDRHDPWMIQPAQGLGLVQKALAVPFGGQGLRSGNLESDLAADHRIMCQEDKSMAARADQVDEGVSAELQVEPAEWAFLHVRLILGHTGPGPASVQPVEAGPGELKPINGVLAVVRPGGIRR